MKLVYSFTITDEFNYPEETIHKWAEDAVIDNYVTTNDFKLKYAKCPEFVDSIRTYYFDVYENSEDAEQAQQEQYGSIKIYVEKEVEDD